MVPWPPLPMFLTCLDTMFMRFGIPFSLEELIQEFQKISLVKSVARPCIPGLLWKMHSVETAHFIYSLLRNWWCRPDFFIPSQWRHAWLTFINKPGNTPDRARQANKSQTSCSARAHRKMCPGTFEPTAGGSFGAHPGQMAPICILQFSIPA